MYYYHAAANPLKLQAFVSVACACLTHMQMCPANAEPIPSARAEACVPGQAQKKGGETARECTPEKHSIKGREWPASEPRSQLASVASFLSDCHS